MNKVVCMLCAMSAGLACAKTELYGEANAFSQIVHTEEGSALQLFGYLSQFGFRNSIPLENETNAFFDVAIGYSITDFTSPWLNESHIGITGEYGQISLFYGPTPVETSNSMLQLMERDPDSLNGLFSASSASGLGIAVGDSAIGSEADGILYESPKLSNNLTLAFAILPTEQIDSDPGFAFSGTYDDQKATLTVGFQVNREGEDDQLLRLIGQTKKDDASLGGGFQFASNRDQETAIRTFFAFAKMPWQIGQKTTQTKLLTGFSWLTDTADDTESEGYFSLVNAQSWNSKVSTYVFAEWWLQNDLEDRTVDLGAGMRISF